MIVVYDTLVAYNNEHGVAERKTERGNVLLLHIIKMANSYHESELIVSMIYGASAVLQRSETHSF